MVSGPGGLVRCVLSRRVAAVVISAASLPAFVAGSSHASGPEFDAPKRIGSGSEPVITIADDGTIFASPIPGLPSHSPLWRSTNGGQSYQSVTFNAPYSRFPGGGDSDVVVAPPGPGESGNRVYFLDLWAGSNSIARSDDNGETWAAGTPFTTLPLTDRQWISLGKRDPVTHQDTVYVVYHFIQPPGNVMFARSSDSGLTWTHHTAPFGAGGALPGHLISDGDFVGYNYVTQDHMYFVYSEDAGQTWSRSKVTFLASVEHSLTAVTMDPVYPDNLYIAWVSRFDHTIEVARSTDRGKTWAFPQTIDHCNLTATETGCDHSAVFPWVDARNGKVAVAWYGANKSGIPDEVSGDWYVQYSETLDGRVTEWRDAVFTPAVNATISVKRGFICTAGLSCNAGREVGDFINVTIDAAGKSLIAYVDVKRNLASIIKQV